MDHAIDAPHDHGGHGHNHHHHHDHAGHEGEYYLEQLLMIFVAGGFGTVALLMFRAGMFNELLAPTFHPIVAVGGGVLLLLTLVRAAAVWAESRKGEACGDGCGHDHGEEGGHEHNHGGMFWRMVVLAFPLLLFGLGLPNEKFMMAFKNSKLGTDVGLGDLAEVQATGGVLGFDFEQLAAAAFDEDKRAAAEGREVSIRGQFKPIAEKEFTLFRTKMTCCAADMIPLKARILAESVPPAYKPYDWVKVTGVVQFVAPPGKKEYIPVVRVKTGGIERAPAES